MKRFVTKFVSIPFLASAYLFCFHANAFPQGRLLANDNNRQQHVLPDKCGYDDVLAKQSLVLLGDHWGYGYDNLLADLDTWSLSPYVTIASLGSSVQGRAIWQLAITSDVHEVVPRRTVFIHARTHPIEVQGWWVTNELINYLLSEDEAARFLREKCVFYIIPMYNPDGVELEYGRENANGIDIESNWDKSPVQPEVAVLRSRFTELMASGAPIEVALNMHSAYACQRYFVYHDAAGTSGAFSLSEVDFIEGIRSYFFEGIQPWYYFISWKSGTPSYYPESWFWLNFREAVIALTYEDMNCTTAGNFDKTALALLYGISDHLHLTMPTVVAQQLEYGPSSFSLQQNFPNPFNPETTIQYQLPKAANVKLEIFNLQGQKVSTLVAEKQNAGLHSVRWHGRDQAGAMVTSGVYLYRIGADEFAQTRKLTLLR